MFTVVIGFVLILIGLQAFLRRKSALANPNPSTNAMLFNIARGPVAGFLMILAGLGFLASTSFALINADKVGHLKRVYLASDLPPGRILALPGQKGPQTEILGPGFHFRPLLNMLYQVEEFDVVQVPEGFYGQITALDGASMPEGMFIAPVIPDE